MFKKGIFPSWEDEVNSKGADQRIVIQECSLESLDKIWETLIFFTIGGNFITDDHDDNNHVTF